MTNPFDQQQQTHVPAPGSQSPARRAAAAGQPQAVGNPQDEAEAPVNPDYFPDQAIREQYGIGPNERVVKNADGTYHGEPEDPNRLDMRAFQALVNATGEGAKEVDHIVVTHTYSNHYQTSPYPVGTELTPDELKVPPGVDTRRYIAELAAINVIKVFYKEDQPVEAVQPTTPASALNGQPTQQPAQPVQPTQPQEVPQPEQPVQPVQPSVPTVSPGNPGGPEQPQEAPEQPQPQGVPEA